MSRICRSVGLSTLLRVLLTLTWQSSCKFRRLLIFTGAVACFPWNKFVIAHSMVFLYPNLSNWICLSVLAAVQLHQSCQRVGSTRGLGRVTIWGKCGGSGRVGSKSGQWPNFQKPIQLSHEILITPIINFYPRYFRKIGWYFHYIFQNFLRG